MSPTHSYPTRNYAIGEHLLKLRSRAKLTQSELAAQIGIHRRTVQKWESGETYPTAENLRVLITVLLTLRVFTPGQEHDEAIDLWQQVRQHAPQHFPLFDTAWFELLQATRTLSELPDQAQTNGDSQPLSAAASPPAADRQGTRDARVVSTQMGNSHASVHTAMLDLPYQPTPLVGRDTDLREVIKILGDPVCRLLTLVGPGGIGKTRLALEVAARLAEVFADGVAFVALDSISTPNQIVAAIGDALHLSFAGQTDPVAHLLNFLRQRHMLLLLDNFEHLLVDTDLVYRMLQHAPHLTLLLTSRQRLNLQAEWLFDVEGLAYPPLESYRSVTPQTLADVADYSAVQLFLQRAKQVHPEFSLQEATLTSIVHICQHVSGMPLAIELAAASMRTLPIIEIERQIRSNLDALTTTLRDVPQRHHNLRAVFDHSWDQLSAPERAILSRMAIFRGGWNQKAVEAICAQVTKQIGLSYTFSPVVLASLVDKSLVQQGHEETREVGLGGPLSFVSEPRFFMLEPIREYALEQLGRRGEIDVLRRAHAMHYLTLAEAAAAQWDSPMADAAIDELDREHDNMRAALQWSLDSKDGKKNADARSDHIIGLRLAGALRKFWRRRGAIREGRIWLEELLALDFEPNEVGVNIVRMRAMQAAAWLASEQHDYARATQLFEQSLALRRLLGEPEDDTHLLVNVALQARATGHYQQATALLKDALARQRALNDRRSLSSGGLGQSLFILGLVCREQGHFAHATALFTECVELHRALGDREGMAIGLLGLSDIARDYGDIAQVRTYAEQSLTILRQLGVQWAIGFALNNLALAAYLDGDLTHAHDLISESIAMFRAQKADGSLAEVLISLGQIMQAQGESIVAHETLTEALQLAQTVGPRLLLPAILEVLAGVVAHAEQSDRAVRLVAAASTLRNQMGTPMRPIDQPAVEQVLASARATLGANAFTLIWSEAEQQSLEQNLHAIPSKASLLDGPEQYVAPPTAAAFPSSRTPRVDWGLAQDVPVLYGRAHELATLTQWVTVEQCRVITLVGIGGIGKSSLAITFARQIALHFATVVFRSLGDAPQLSALLDQLIHSVAEQQIVVPAHSSEKLALLIDLLRQQRSLLILDNLETILQVGTVDAQYLAGYEAYATLFKVLGETAHQSCLLLTSRERLVELTALEGPRASVRSLRVTGLPEDACRALIKDQELAGPAGDAAALARRYDGNPLALKLVADPIRALFGGDIVAFLTEGSLFLGGVGQLLSQQINRASALEQALLTWLALLREPVPLDQLMANLMGGASRAMVLIALQALWRRNLVERGLVNLTFTLQPVILEYMTEQLMTTVHQEIVDGQPRLLQSHALLQAYAKDYVRHSQERVILTRLLKPLLVLYGDAGSLARQMLSLLDSWREQPFAEHGFGPGNVVNLLRLQRGDLRRLNLARLELREVYWQGVEAQDSSLAHAQVRENVFTETFGIVHAVTASASGSYWAASSISGTVQVWRNEGRTTHLSIAAHSKHVKTLAFSPDEQILATGSWDCTIKLWEMQGGTLVGLLTGHQDYVQDVAFSPDGGRLVSVGDDRTLRIWDSRTGTLLTTIQAHNDSIHGTAWSPDSKWVASCGVDMVVHIWEVASGACVQTFVGHTRNVRKVAFSPDGLMLASASYDRTVRIWDLTSGKCIKLFVGHESTVMALVWHADGRILASCSYDGTIRLWDLDRDSAPRILHGHGASINSIAFTAGGAMLLSGSDDQTVRLWDVTSGRCVRVIEGYGLFFVDVVWSPDGRSLLSANSDATLTVWNVADGSVRIMLRGHTHTVYGVAWSPDGLWLASNGFDQTVRIWDAKTGVCLRIIPVPTDLVNRVVKWSPDGRWLASVGRDRAVRIWDMTMGTSLWVGSGHTGAIHEVVWSADGQRLASCSDDHTVRLWRAEDGTLLQTLVGHESSAAGVAWSPNGRYVASCGGGGTNGEIFLWEAESGDRLKSLVGHNSVVLRLVWSQDSKCLISGSMTGAIHWWDVESGTLLHRQQSHQGWIRSLCVSPDGSRLVSSGEDGVIHLWDVAQAELIHTLRLDRPYERMDINGLSGITKAQRTALIALGAVESSNWSVQIA